jgi:hypothetical protein
VKLDDIWGVQNLGTTALDFGALNTCTGAWILKKKKKSSKILPAPLRFLEIVNGS